MNKDVFLALAAIGWADGTLDADEADAIVRAAVEAGLDLDVVSEVEHAVRQPVDLGEIDRAALTKEDRLFVYAVACWIARLDGKVSDAETLALSRLGDKLGVPERPRASVETIAREVADLPPGDRPARYDLVGLRERIAQRLSRAQGAQSR